MRLGAVAGWEPKFIEGNQKAVPASELARVVLCEKGMPDFLFASLYVAALAIPENRHHQFKPLERLSRARSV